MKPFRSLRLRITLLCALLLTPVSYTHLDVYKRQPSPESVPTPMRLMFRS